MIVRPEFDHHPIVRRTFLHVGNQFGLRGRHTRDDNIRMMVGREITDMFPKGEAEITDTVLSVDGLTLDGVFHDISFDLRKGEILGLAGLVGSGRSNVAEALFGVTPATSGTIRIDGQKARITSPADAVRYGTHCHALSKTFKNRDALLLIWRR